MVQLIPQYIETRLTWTNISTSEATIPLRITVEWYVPLMHHANSIVSDSSDLTKEKDCIRKALNMNGYPDLIMNYSDHKLPTDHEVSPAGLIPTSASFTEVELVGYGWPGHYSKSPLPHTTEETISNRLGDPLHQRVCEEIL